MKTSNLFILILSTLILISCSKEELNYSEGDPAVGSIVPQSVNCTPKVTDYDYVENVDIIDIGLDCVPELISVDEFTIHHKGRIVRSAGCHINNKGSEEGRMTGTGYVTGDTYTLYFLEEYHFNGTRSDFYEKTTVYNITSTVIITNETTGESYSGIDLKIHVTYNAHGELTSAKFDEFVCD